MRIRSDHRQTAWGAAVLMGCWALVACSAGSTTTDSSASSTVTIEPGGAIVIAGTSQPFIAAVTGTVATGVTWSVEEGPTGGHVSPTGVYRAPARPGTYHVVAASRINQSRRGRVAVNVVPPEDVVVAIASPQLPAVSLPPGGAIAFLASVTGTGNHNVLWTVETGREVPGGSINVDGVYTAPAFEAIRPYLEDVGSVTAVVRARSMADMSRSATRPVVIELQSPPLTISPPSSAVGLGEVVTLVLSETLSAGTIWTVNNVPGGHSGIGTISSHGVYTAPFVQPDPATVAIGNTVGTNQVAVTMRPRFLPTEPMPVHACAPACPLARPVVVVAADLNGDGLTDLATANAGSGTVSILIAANASYFAVPYRLEVGGTPSASLQGVVVARLDGDHVADLVTISSGPDGGVVRARFGAGDGTFGGDVVSQWPGGAEPVALSSGDFNGDGVADLLVADLPLRVLHVLQGEGNGRFFLGASLADASRALRPSRVAVADFDRNGRDDVVVASGDHTVLLWLTNADGSFRHVHTIVFPVGQVVEAVAAADLNSDTLPDLVATLSAPPGVSVVLNRAVHERDLFAAPSPRIAAGAMPFALATGDFNRDGSLDVVIADRSESAITTLFGNGQGVLVRSESYALGAVPDGLATGDFNGDGWTDVAVVHAGSDIVSVIRNRGGRRTP